MATIGQRQAAREPREKQLPDFTVRARVGPGQRDWMRIGSAWRRTKEDGSEIITVVLGATPIAVNNRVTLKLLEPIEEAADGEPLPEPSDE